jgi:lysyl-tRNA synthetase class II
MMALGQIYTFGPCFRAEKSSTKKHLSEFWMVEPEMAFYSLEETIDFSEEMLKSMLSGILKYEDDLLAKSLQRYSVTGQIIQEVSSGMKSSMMDFFDYTSAGFGKLNNLAISLGNTIYKAVVQQMVVNPLVSSLTSAATGFFSTPTATGGGTYNGVTSSAIKVESAKGNIFNSPSLSVNLVSAWRR